MSIAGSIAMSYIARPFLGRIRRWLHNKYKLRRSNGGTYALSHLDDYFGLARLEARGRSETSCLRAGNLYILFDERDVETGFILMLLGRHQTKGVATDKPNLPLPRHISTGSVSRDFR